MNAARADILAISHAGALGVERTAHVHARSLLENLVRHCYFDSRPSLFVARSVFPEEDVRDIWADLLKEIQRLPHGVRSRDLGAAPARRSAPRLAGAEAQAFPDERRLAPRHEGAHPGGEPKNINQAVDSALVLQPYLRSICGCRRADGHGFLDDFDVYSRTSDQVRL
ncbi:hypothetical protein predicted by Glimmer/Critica [Sorangium cellulosum So ce56]|uniref:Uncharacterized protein n=1 Tax=Sorangium cellulosum (strain So ce56) TaxID=448385 RepID=A9GND8_SORC5|nr:hypothetical protein predicted by Glimmer/Critica [Sorangium cellulosum So ce56]